MEIKHSTSILKDITPGSVKDDAQYINLLFENKSRQVSDLFTCKLNDGSEYTGRLFGKSDIIDSDGFQINDCNIYLDFISNNKKNLLHFNRMSGIEVLNKDGKILNVFTSMSDCFDYLKKKELKN